MDDMIICSSNIPFLCDSRPIFLRIVTNSQRQCGQIIGGSINPNSPCQARGQQMPDYTQIIKGLLQKQYPNKETPNIVISTLHLRFFTPKAQLLMQSYLHLKNLSITNCDLRKLENFPVLPLLANLDLSSNSLQGTLNYLMPLKSLSYLNLSRNMIAEVKNLQPLRRIKNLEVFLNDNPVTQVANWKNRVRNVIIVLKSPKNLAASSKDEHEERKQKQQMIKFKQEPMKQLHRPMKRPSNYGATFSNRIFGNFSDQMSIMPLYPDSPDSPEIEQQIDIKIDLDNAWNMQRSDEQIGSQFQFQMIEGNQNLQMQLNSEDCLDSEDDEDEDDEQDDNSQPI